jgi:hypothetical protein
MKISFNQIPTFEFFRGAFYRLRPKGVWSFHDGRHLGEELTCTELYSELVTAAEASDKDPESGRWASEVLGLMGFRSKLD